VADVTDAADSTCQWRTRDPAGWRAGILFNASADLLVAWHTAALVAAAEDWTATQRRLGAGVEQVRRARWTATWTCSTTHVIA
jgi:hypothetical protein